jgi:thiamine kinase-like enzyme
MNSINLFKDRVFYSSHKKRCSPKESEFIEVLLSKIKKPIKFPSNIELISINDEYDLYKFDYKNISFCLKVSLDPECEEIKKEFKNLKKINSTISPFLCESGKVKIGDEVAYLLTTFENAESVGSFGSSIILEEFDSFCRSYQFFQNSDKNKYTFKNYLNDFLKKHDLNNFMGEALIAMKNHTDFERINKFIEDVKNDLKELMSDELNQNNFLCHGDLNTKNILYRNGAFKFINFKNCFSAHCFLDLADLFVSMGVNQKVETQMLKDFCRYFNINYEINKNLYTLCYNIAIRKNIINIVFDYLKEIYVFSALREDKFVYISHQFANNYQRYLMIDHFFQNRDFFLKTIIEPFSAKKS